MKKIAQFIIGLAVICLILVVFTAANDVSNAPVSLTGPDFNFDKIIFIKHQPYPDNQGVNTLNGYSEQHMIDQYFGFNGVPNSGNGLYILENALSGSPTARNLL